MRKGAVLGSLSAVTIVAVLAASYGTSSSRDRAAGGADKPGPRDQTLRAEAHVTALTPVRDTVRTVGTLMANESVNLVSELSRRLVEIHVVEGAEVEKGDLLFKLDDAGLQAQLNELEARRKFAATTEARYSKLLAEDKQAVSQQDYDEGVAELRAVESQIAAVKVLLERTEIRAPFRGRAGLRRVSEGAWITPETPLITLLDTSRIKIDFTLPERYAGAIRTGQQFEFTVAGHGEKFNGQVIAYEPRMDAGTRSVVVRGLTDNPSRVLFPGAFAQVEVPIERADPGILVPAQAIVPSAAGHSVYVLREGAAELREVKIGLRTKEHVEVVSGLAPGETVLTSNLLRMRAGARVEVANPVVGAS